MAKKKAEWTTDRRKDSLGQELRPGDLRRPVEYPPSRGW